MRCRNLYSGKIKKNSSKCCLLKFLYSIQSDNLKIDYESLFEVDLRISYMDYSHKFLNKRG